MSLTAATQEICRERLTAGLIQLQLNYTEDQLNRWLSFLNLLNKWNKAYNLTAVRDPAEMVSRHLLDSLGLVPHITAERLIDVGTGPGLPGIPLAIAFPEKQWALLDSNGKRTRFLQQVKVELGLNNIEILNSRVEDHQPAEPYQAVLSRAFASLNDMLQWTAHLCAKDGRYLAMKGQYPDDEISQLPDGYQVAAVHSLQIPGSDAERHLVIISPPNV